MNRACFCAGSVLVSSPRTGVTSLSTELSGERLGLLKEALPQISRVGVVWAEDNEFTTVAVRDIETAGGAIGVTIHSVGAHGRDALEPAFEQIARSGADAIVVVSLLVRADQVIE